MTYKDKILIYIVRKLDSADSELLEHNNYYRYRSCDELDYLESIIRKVRRDTIKEVLDDMLTLTRINDKLIK